MTFRERPSRSPGKERDSETGLDYFGARYYASSFTRFVTVDPIAITVRRLTDPQQLNLYSYTRNNPLVYVDPDGQNLSFRDKDSENAFAGYMSSLDANSQEYASMVQLIQSDVDYVLQVGGGSYTGSEEGRTAPNEDGSAILLQVKNDGNGHEKFSLNGRIAHEVEHGRQFDSGEVSFIKNTKGEWRASPSSYDIYDEVKAFKAQLRVSPKDGNVDVLKGFATAKSDDERAGILVRISDNYKNTAQHSQNVHYTGRKPGELVRSKDGLGVNHP